VAQEVRHRPKDAPILVESSFDPSEDAIREAVAILLREGKGEREGRAA